MTVSEYNACVDAYADGVFRFIVKNMKHKADAEDIVQNAFEVLWQKHDTIDTAKAKSFLFTVAHNKMIDQIRKTKRMHHPETMPDRPQVDANAAQTGLQETLQEALDRLPEVQKKAILLRDYEGYAYDEIAEILQLSASQVKVYIFRARKALQKYLVSIENVL